MVKDLMPLLNCVYGFHIRQAHLNHFNYPSNTFDINQLLAKLKIWCSVPTVLETNFTEIEEMTALCFLSLLKHVDDIECEFTSVFLDNICNH